MADYPKVGNWVCELTTTTGSGPITLLGPLDGFTTFSTIGDGQVYYVIENGQNKEAGIGTLSGNTLSRDTILSTFFANKYSDANSPIQLAGPSTVYSAINAQQYSAMVAMAKKLDTIQEGATVDQTADKVPYENDYAEAKNVKSALDWLRKHVSTTGPAITGDVEMKNFALLGDGNSEMIRSTAQAGSTPKRLTVGSYDQELFLKSLGNPKVNTGTTTETLFHTGNKPTPDDLGAPSYDFGLGVKQAFVVADAATNPGTWNGGKIGFICFDNTTQNAEHKGVGLLFRVDATSASKFSIMLYDNGTPWSRSWDGTAWGAWEKVGDPNAYSKNGGDLLGPMTIKAFGSPLFFAHTFPAVPTNRQGAFGLPSSGIGEYIWGVGVEANNQIPSKVFFGLGSTPWSTGLIIEANKISFGSNELYHKGNLGTDRIRAITVSANAPSGSAEEGSIWIQY